MFEQHQLERDLRVALTLKADDLKFTVGGERGRKLQAEFLGIEEFDGLAGESFDEAGLAEIDLSKFEIGSQVSFLAQLVRERRWGPMPGRPDTELERYDNLEFLEHFLSTLPSVALGGEDSTSVRAGPLRDLYLTSAAWLDLVDAVRDAFAAEPHLFSLELAQLALLSGRDLRTIRNQAGPGRALRTTAERQLRRSRTVQAPAFVNVQTFDAVDFLRRRGFEFQPLSIAWARDRFADAPDALTKARCLLMLALINLGPRMLIASMFGLSEERLRCIEDGAEPLQPSAEEQLRAALEF